jgi:hypothetical protein
MVDEPYLGLAPQMMKQMSCVFETLKAEGMAILFVEQNVRPAISMASGYILESGRFAIRRVIESPGYGAFFWVHETEPVGRSRLPRRRLHRWQRLLQSRKCEVFARAVSPWHLRWPIAAYPLR